MYVYVVTNKARKLFTGEDDLMEYSVDTRGGWEPLLIIPGHTSDREALKRFVYLYRHRNTSQLVICMLLLKVKYAGGVGGQLNSNFITGSSFKF